MCLILCAAPNLIISCCNMDFGRLSCIVRTQMKINGSFKICLGNHTAICSPHFIHQLQLLYMNVNENDVLRESNTVLTECCD